MQWQASGSRTSDPPRYMKDVAILARRWRTLYMLERALLKERVPYEMPGGMFWLSYEVQDMLSYIKISALLGNCRDEDVMRVINRPSRNIRSKTIKRLKRWAEVRIVRAWTP